MKNLRKVLALVLALAIVLSTFTTAFAADVQNTDKATTLNTLGLYLGTSTTEFTPDLAAGATRAQAIVVIGRALGWTVDMEVKAVANFTDVPEWAAPYVKVAVEKNVTNGVSEDKFGADAAVTMRQVYTWYYRAMGFEGDVWANPSLLVAAGLATQEVANGLVTAALTGTEVGATRDQLVGLMFATLTLKAKGKTTTLIEDLVAAGKVDEAKAVAGKLMDAIKKLDVVSATMTGYKEVFVTLNDVVTTTGDASKVANYEVKVGDTVKGISAAAVSADGKVVTLTLGDGQEIAQAATVVVKAKKEIGMATDKAITISTVIDATLPTVATVALTGPTTFEITFSEPLNESVNPTVLINNGQYGSTVTKVDGKVVTVALPGILTNGDYTIAISGAKDIANLTMVAVEKVLTYTKVTSDVAATITSSTQKEVKVKFDQPLKKDLVPADFYQTYATFVPNSVTMSDNNTVATLDFSTYSLNEGSGTLVIKKDNIESTWGNKVSSNISLAFIVVVDKIAPTVALGKVDAEDAITLAYVDASGINVSSATLKANYVLKDKDGKVVDKVSSISAPNADKKVTVTFTGKLAGGNYTLTVKDVTDNTLQANKIVETTIPFTITDLTAPAPVKAEYVLSDGIVYATFNEAMGASALELANWRVNGVAPKTAAFFNGDAKVVKLTFEDKTVVTGVALVGPVADAAGNKIASLSTTITKSAVVGVEIVSARTIAKDKVEVTLGGKLVDGLKATNFWFAVGSSTTPEAATYLSSLVNDKNQTVVTLVMNSKVVYAADGVPYTITVGALKSDTLFVATPAAFMLTTDGIAPTVSEAATTLYVTASAVTTTVALSFTENLTQTAVNLFAFDLVVTYDGGTALTPGTDYTTAVSGKDLVITLNKTVAAGKEIKVKSKDSITYIKDLAGNKADVITEKTIKVQ